MPKVIFKKDIREDLKNILACIYTKWFHNTDFKNCLDPALLKNVKGKSKAQTKKLVRDLLNQKYKKEVKFIKLAIKQTEEAWRLIENKFFKRLEKVTNKPICSQRFIASLTTVGRCPYDREHFWFMFGYYGSPIRNCNTCAHEILHMQFLHYYWNKLYKKVLTPKQLWDLTESLNFLLNEEFSDMLIFEDKAYHPHIKLRKKLTKIWRKEKDFEKLVEKGIKIVKCKKY